MAAFEKRSLCTQFCLCRVELVIYRYRCDLIYCRTIPIFLDISILAKCSVAKIKIIINPNVKYAEFSKIRYIQFYIEIITKTNRN